MKKSDNTLLIYAIGIGAGYFLVVKPLLEKLGILKSTEEVLKEKTEAANVTDQQRILQKSGLKLTKSKAEWDSIANQIYNDLKYSAIDDNKANAGYQVARVQNDLDMVYLIQSFGKRQEYYFGLPAGEKKSLASFITSNLSDAAIQKLNANYASKKMKFRF